MNFSCKAQPVDLPPAHNSTPAEADAVLSGWGKPQVSYTVLLKISYPEYTSEGSKHSVQVYEYVFVILQ